MSAATFDATGFGALLEIEGTVAERPVVRTKPVGETGEPMPVLCLRVNTVKPTNGRSFTCELIFPIGQHAAAHARRCPCPRRHAQNRHAHQGAGGYGDGRVPLPRHGAYPCRTCNPHPRG